MSRRDDVLDALLAADGGLVSGETVARRLGISRVAVAKHIDALRRTGIPIESRQGRGYRLADASSVLTAGQLTDAMPDGWRLSELLDEVGSTNDALRARAAAGEPAGAVVVARRQTAGRGRLGRTWESPPGGLYVSVLMRPAVAPAALGPLALAVSLGVARAVERLGARPWLKWPNDVGLAEGKLAGVLLEMAADVDRVDWIVAGVGVNVRRPEAAQPNAAYLDDEVPDVSMRDVAAALLENTHDTCDEFLANGFGAMRADYVDRLNLVGSIVQVRDVGGALRSEGTAEGVDEQGRLLIRDAQGTVAALASGDVTLRDAEEA